MPRTFFLQWSHKHILIYVYRCSIKAPPSFVAGEENTKVNLVVQRTVKKKGKIKLFDPLPL